MPDGLGAFIDRLAQVMLTRLETGDLAELRRLDPADPACPAFWRLVAGYLGPAGYLPLAGAVHPKQERRWATVVNAMAHLGALHRRGVALGGALARAGYSELRLVRLLRAQDAPLHDAVRLTARFVASHGEAVDAADLARLVLVSREDLADAIRRRIARDYYANV